MKLLPLLSVIVLLQTTPAAAVDDNGNYQLYDYDKFDTCTEYLIFLKTANQNRLGTLAAWMRGYMTGFNQGKPGKRDFFEVAGEAELVSWLAIWCQLNRSSSLHKGLIRFTVNRRF